ncbi:acetyltransferase [Pseudomonas sp. MIACH]|uniref:acetyltransferase n=1 Tax=Pseudomonas sp. MIACH TaxID=1078355 RepID=UPI00069CF0C6|nr:acetyltransferase [Pseudomonas sp. MIACH]
MTESGRDVSQLPFVILGAGGHAKVLLALLQSMGAVVKGVCDPALAHSGIEFWRGVRVLGGDEALNGLDPTQVALVNGLGQVIGSDRRMQVFMELTAKGYTFPALLHSAAWIDSTVVLEAGAQIMAGAVIQPDSVIGANTIINTGARVDHDCIIASHVHIAPGAVLCGGVKVATGAFVGAGSTTLQGRSIGENAIVAAGSTLVRDLQAGHLVVSSPMRIHESKFKVQPKKS